MMCCSAAMCFRYQVLLGLQLEPFVTAQLVANFSKQAVKKGPADAGVAVFV